jgi:cytochrome c-type biogenesis protein CcmE
MKRGPLYIVGVLILLAFAAFSLSSFRQTLTPYVSFEQARTAGRLVQVAGGLQKGSSKYEMANGSLLFTLRDPHNQQQMMRVRYHGLKPGNFEDAISIVAIGQYDEHVKEFAADKLLVKCPSKYQGGEVEKTYS